MTRKDFLNAMQANGIRSDAFSLDGQCNECYVLEGRYGGWVVFYSERGLETGIRNFASEEEALDYLLQTLLGDSTAKQ